jgi:hypothetical protein
MLVCIGIPVFILNNILQSPHNKGFVFLAIFPAAVPPKPQTNHLHQRPNNARATG